jgi:hypothetical protein
MLSTRADRYYGPPDGIQPEFDLLSRHNRCRDRAANYIGQFTPWLKPKSGSAAGRRTIHHNSSSRKTSVTPFREQDFKIYGQANRVPVGRSIARGKAHAAVHLYTSARRKSLSRSERSTLFPQPATLSILPPKCVIAKRIRLLWPPVGLRSFQHLISAVQHAPHPTGNAFGPRPACGNQRSDCSARHCSRRSSKDRRRRSQTKPADLVPRSISRWTAGAAQIRSRVR